MLQSRARFTLQVIVLVVVGVLLGAACANSSVGSPEIAEVPSPDAGASSGFVTPTEDAGGKPVEDASANDGPDPDTAPAPTLTSITPAKATVGSPGPTIVLAGKDFVARSVAQLDGAPLPTTFVSATELKATLPTAKLAATGSLKVSVGTSAPGGGVSAELPFAVENPLPTATALSPLSAVAGSPDTNVTVTGTGFVTGVMVTFGGVALSTTLNSPTSVTAVIPAAKLVTAGSFDVAVKNPTPGGGTSAAIAFTVSNPNVTVTSISPTNALVGSAAFTLTVNGTGFVAASKILFNGAAITTTFVSATQLTGAVPASALTTVGDFPVAVSSPPPGGGVSAPLSFRVQYPVPTLASIAPTSATAGSAPLQITATGTGFFPASQITFDGAAAATTYVSDTQLKATLSAAQLASAGTINVRVVTPTPGGGTSTAIAFTINNPAPTITSVSPSAVAVGAPDTNVILTGTNYVASSTVRANGTPVATTYMSATQVKAVIPAAQLASPTTIALTVVNGAPGGGTSNSVNLTVGCNTTGVDVTLGSLGATSTVTALFSSAPTMSRFTASGTCPTTLDGANPQPGRFWIVQNTSSAPITLSAWAVCTASGKSDDAFLTFYRRATAPASDAERQACTGVVSEGASGAGGYGSPEPGASTWCPGLTKANGGGIALGVCEKAVVHAQPWSNASTSFPPPPQFRFKAE